MPTAMSVSPPSRADRPGGGDEGGEQGGALLPADPRQAAGVAAGTWRRTVAPSLVRTAGRGRSVGSSERPAVGQLLLPVGDLLLAVVVAGRPLPVRVVGVLDGSGGSAGSAEPSPAR